MNIDFIRVSVLAVIQGISEFLPVSSSAHLIFPSALLHWEDQGLAFDVAVHLGSLTAVIVYFRKDIRAMLTAWVRNIVWRERSEDARLAWMLLLASMPLIIAGYLLRSMVDDYLRDTAVIAFTSIFFGILLGVADRMRAGRDYHDLGWKAYLAVGLAQALALVPGTSRSGVTMTAALFLRLNREAASRLSFLLSIPAIAGAAFLLLLDLLDDPAVNWGELVYSTVLAGIVAFLCIHYFLKLIPRIGFLPFVIYRLLLGGVLIFFFI